MKKILVTGAAGAVGVNVIKYLLSEGKYEITAMDLRTKMCQKRLKRYRRRINIVYGDITDSVLMDALVKKQDVIIHLAGSLPPIADIKQGIGKEVDYMGAKNIVEAIENYNPKCFLIYASSTTIYGNVLAPTVQTKSKLSKLDYYSNTKLKVENLIAKNVKNYTIMRLPLLLTNPNTDAFMYNVSRKSEVEAISDQDAGYLFVEAIEHMSELKKKAWNATGGESCQTTYQELLANVLKIYGFSFKYFLTLLFMDKNFYTHTYPDANDLENILNFRNDSLSSYYMRLKRQVKGRYIAKLLAKPFIFILERKSRKAKNLML